MPVAAVHIEARPAPLEEALVVDAEEAEHRGRPAEHVGRHLAAVGVAREHEVEAAGAQVAEDPWVVAEEEAEAHAARVQERLHQALSQLSPAEAAEVERVSRETQRAWIGVATVVLTGLALAAVVTGRLAASILAPIDNLRTAVRAFSRGESPEAPKGGDDELVELGAAFTEMVGRVQAAEARRVERERVWREKLEADRRASEAADPTAASGSGGPTRSIDRQVDAVLAATTGDEASAVAPPAIDVADTTAVVKPPDPFRQARPEEGTRMDPAREQFTGIVPGIGLASFRDSTGVDRFLVLPGDDVKVTFPTAGTPPKAVSDSFTIVDYYESKMSEYDSNFVFVPLAMLQRMRGMIDPQTGLASVNSIQIKLREGADLDLVRDKLRKVFPADLYAVATWRDKQGPLLAAVDMEMSVLNILLFLIIAVAGFGILAIFFMIVVEKTRDIGILKSLGAGASGIAGIFLGYGLFLGLVGAGAGLAMGLAIAWNINTIRVGVEWLTGQRVFDPSIYYFHRIPSIVDPFTVAWIIVGAVGIAVASSVLPALRAARLHPVEALRHD